MGRTPIPLVIWVDSAWADHAEVQALKDKGHSVLALRPDAVPDIILSRAAHAWADDMWKLLPNVLKAARQRRKEAPGVDDEVVGEVAPLLPGRADDRGRATGGV